MEERGKRKGKGREGKGEGERGGEGGVDPKLERRSKKTISLCRAAK